MQKQQKEVANPIAEEATRGFIEMVTQCRNLRDKHKEELENMRIQMMHNFNSLMENIEENCKWSMRESDEEVAKKWIRNNLEEAQQLIDNIVGIKGITEDPLKVAAELEGMGLALMPMEKKCIMDGMSLQQTLPERFNASLLTMERKRKRKRKRKRTCHVFRHLKRSCLGIN